QNTGPLSNTDSDNDGLPDDWETYHNLDPADPADGIIDTDGDGLTNLEEVQWGTNPNLADSDGDTVDDGEDGWPLLSQLAPPRLEVPQYAIIELSDQPSDGLSVNDSGEVVYEQNNPHQYYYSDLLSVPTRIQVDGQDVTGVVRISNQGKVAVNYPAGATVSYHVGSNPNEATTFWHPQSEGAALWTTSSVEKLSGSGVLDTSLPVSGIGSFPDLTPSPGQSPPPVESLVRISKITALSDEGKAAGSSTQSYEFLYGTDSDHVIYRLGWQWPNGQVLGQEKVIVYAYQAQQSSLVASQYFLPHGISDYGVMVGGYVQSQQISGTGVTVTSESTLGDAYKSDSGNAVLSALDSVYGINAHNHILGIKDGKNSILLDQATDIYGVPLNMDGTPTYGAPLDFDHPYMDLPPGGRLNTRYQMASANLFWQNGQYLDLNELTHATQGTSPAWDNIQAKDINNHGVIVGSALHSASGQRRAVLLLPVEIATDSNRDGEVVMQAESNLGLPVDVTTTEKPYQFWINNDRDSIGDESTSFEQDDADPNAGNPDYSNGEISNQRDLEDFSRLWIYIGGFHEEIKNGEIEVGLEWKNLEGTPAINIYNAADSQFGSADYLFEIGAANQQMLPEFRSKIGTIGPDAFGVVEEFRIPVAAFQNLSEVNTKTFFLFEGTKTGKGELTLVFYRGQEKIGSGHVMNIELLDVKEMYDHMTVGDVIGNNLDPATIPLTPSSADPSIEFKYEPAAEDYIVFVHGWRMQPWERRAFAETSFKRLSWQGYQGRFGFYSWPTDWHDGSVVAGLADPRNYSRAEWKSYISGIGLREWLEDLKGDYSSLNLMAHSMGNIVASEALRIEASSQAPSVLIDTYVASQAASVAQAYDENAPETLIFPPTQGPSTPNVYPDYMATGTPYYNNISAVATQIVNYHNVQDYALIQPTNWPLGQQSKPDLFYDYSSSEGYTYDPVGPFNEETLYFPDDRYEIFARIAEARSRAFGAETTVSGPVSDDINLNAAPYNFGGAREEHSGQFRSHNMARDVYWERLLITFGLKDVVE
ncbi:MAG: hypothetical protein AAF571_13760, partial [Verrucomicrobiota bacterium]